ncbi:MAG: dUTP diphosphatase [Fusobacteriaceae bacterium]
MKENVLNDDFDLRGFGVTICDFDASNPTPNLSYATDLSAGFDFLAAEGVVIPPNSIRVVRTGKMAKFSYFGDTIETSKTCGIMPELQMRSKSGRTISGLIVANAPGTVDADYMGEIKAILMNISNVDINISIGDKICQGVICFVTNNVRGVNIEKVERKDGGFGSTTAPLK